MMEQLQKPADTVEMVDSERGLKRNITAIRTPNRNTGKYKKQTNTLVSVAITKVIVFFFFYLCIFSVRKFAVQVSGSEGNENSKTRNDL